MKQILFDQKKGIVKLKPESLDDLWYLSTIVDPGDIVRGKTFRKIKIGEGEKQKVIKKPMTLTIKVEKIEFTSNVLRLSGVITEAPEEIPKGSYHTINVEEQTILTISKKWMKFQIDRLKEAVSAKISKILICNLDREEAYFALLKRQGYEILSHIKGKIQKKAVDEKVKSTFYQEVLKQLIEYDSRYKLDKIIVASPSFWKEDMMKEVKDDGLKKKIILATCSDVGASSISEILKRPETAEALKQARLAEETKLIENMLAEISKEGLAAYGMKETTDAVNAGAVNILLVTDALIGKLREKGKYPELDQIMKIVESTKGEIHIISTEHEAGNKLENLGGIGAILRYKMSY